jgi:hypothetical protein
MNQPNFEQYKKDQAKIEIIPKIKTDFYFTLNDFSRRIINNEELTENEINELEMIYNTTQDLEKELISILDFYRSNNILTKSEFLISSNYFLIANQNGPGSNNIKNRIIEKKISDSDFYSYLKIISIPENIRMVLVRMYKKIIESGR